MRPLYVSFLATKLILSTALTAENLFEAPLDSGGLPYDVATNIEGTRCDVIGLGITFFGIRLRRSLCSSGLSVLGDTFEKDIHAQKTVSDYLTQIQCCVDVACQTGSEEYGYCVNDEKECYGTAPRPGNDCPTPNTKCCTKEMIVNEPLLDFTKAAPEQLSSNWDQFDTGSSLSFNNPDENSGNLALSTFGGDEQLFSNASPGIGPFDDGGQLFDFGA